MASLTSKFHDWLDKLKVTNEHRPSRDVDLDWMWTDPQCASFLDWLTEHIDGSNVVSPIERRQ